MDPRNKILITGGYGFVGQHLARSSLERGHRVILYGHKPKDEKPFKDMQREFTDTLTAECRLRLVYGEIVDDQFHQLLHEEPDIAMVFHLAAMKTTTDTQDRAAGELLARNYDTDIEVVEFCESVISNREEGDARPVRLVYLSTGEVYGESFDTYPIIREETPCIVRPDQARFLYPVSKIVGEMTLKHSVKEGGWRFQWCIARLQNPYGPGMGTNMLIPKLLHAAIDAQQNGSSTFALKLPNDKRPYIYIKDVAHALNTIMDVGRNGETYNIAGLINWKMADVARMVVDMFAKDKLQIISEDSARGTTRGVSVSKFEAEMAGAMMPLTALGDGLQRTYDWYAKQYAVEKSMREFGI